MIRAFEQDDAARVVGLVVAAEVFTAEEAPFVEQVLHAYPAASQDEGHVCVVDEDEVGLLGVACYQPTTATDRVWDLTMIAVRPQRHGRGTVGDSSRRSGPGCRNGNGSCRPRPWSAILGR